MYDKVQIYQNVYIPINNQTNMSRVLYL